MDILDNDREPIIFIKNQRRILFLGVVFPSILFLFFGIQSMFFQGNKTMPEYIKGRWQGRLDPNDWRNYLELDFINDLQLIYKHNTNASGWNFTTYFYYFINETKMSVENYRYRFKGWELRVIDTNTLEMCCLGSDEPPLFDRLVRIHWPSLALILVGLNIYIYSASKNPQYLTIKSKNKGELIITNKVQLVSSVVIILVGLVALFSILYNSMFIVFYIGEPWSQIIGILSGFLCISVGWYLMQRIVFHPKRYVYGVQLLTEMGLIRLGIISIGYNIIRLLAYILIDLGEIWKTLIEGWVELTYLF